MRREWAEADKEYMDLSNRAMNELLDGSLSAMIETDAGKMKGQLLPIVDGDPAEFPHVLKTDVYGESIEISEDKLNQESLDRAIYYLMFRMAWRINHDRREGHLPEAAYCFARNPFREMKRLPYLFIQAIDAEALLPPNPRGPRTKNLNGIEVHAGFSGEIRSLNEATVHAA